MVLKKNVKIDKKFYQELLKKKSNPQLKANRKGIIVKGKEFYIPILNTHKITRTQGLTLYKNHSNRAEASSLKLYIVSVFERNNELIIYQIVSTAISCLYLYYDKKLGQLLT